MKRRGGFYKEIYSFENLYNAYLKTRKGRRFKKEVLNLSFYLEESLFKLKEELRDESYVHGGYKEFIIKDSKKRKIKAPCLRDRIVHHALCNKIDNVFDNTFYFYSYACRKGKGNHKAVWDLKRKLKNKKGYYCLKVDISKYFDSINCCFLLKKIERKIKDKKVINLIEKILKSNEQGIPIGNLTSQLFANIYLNELDSFIKRKMGVKYYFRYMDDFLIFEEDKHETKIDKRIVKGFCKEILLLNLNIKVTKIFPVNTGIDFLGYNIFERYILPKRKTILKLMKKINRLNFNDRFNSFKAYANKTKSFKLGKSLGIYRGRVKVFMVILFRFLISINSIAFYRVLTLKC